MPSKKQDRPNVGYEAANQHDDPTTVLPADEMDKSNRSFWKKCAFYSCLVGFGFIVLGIVFAFIMEPLVESRIRANLPLVEGSKAFNGWKDPPVTPLLFLRLFNLTNEKEFLSGEAKPKLVELGPYVYRVKMTKEHIKFPSQNAVGFDVHRVYHFAPELSNGSESDMVTVPNVPLFAAIEYMKGEGAFAKDLFKDFVESFEFANDIHPFYTRSVKEYLWGTPSIFVSVDRTQSLECTEKKNENELEWDDFNAWGWDYGDNAPIKKEAEEAKAIAEEKEKKPMDSNMECEVTPDNMDMFGLFRGRNLSYLDPREIHTGYNNLSSKGIMISWHNQRVLNYWRAGSDCNSLDQARDPGNLPLNIDKKDTLKLFFGNLGRNINFKYIQETFVDTFKTYRFAPVEDTFHNPEDNEANLCYCMRTPCLPSGLHDVETIKDNSPIILSWPHFLYGDPSLRKAIDGLSPDPNLHRFFMDVQPDYGIQLAVLARLQMNVEITKRDGFGYFESIQDDLLYYPLGWIEEGITGPSEEMAEKVTTMLTMPKKMKVLMGFAGMGLGLLLLIPEIVFWIKSCCRKPEKLDDE